MLALWACDGGKDDSTAPVEEAPEIVVDPLEIDFGEVSVDGAPSDPVDLSIYNEGTADLTLTAIRVYCLGPFTVTPSDGVVTPGGALHATVLFDPVLTGEQTNLIEVLSLDADEPVVQVTLSGTGI